MAEREREISVDKDTVKRIRAECQTREDTIEKMEGEFPSSGKQLQGIIQTLGMFDYYRRSLVAAETGFFPFELG